LGCTRRFVVSAFPEALDSHRRLELRLGGLTNSREAYIARLFEVGICFLDRTKLDRSKPAVLTVPFRNSKPGLTHAVYWNGTRIYDPNEGRKGRKSYTSEAAWEVAIDGYQRPTRKAM